MRLFWLLASGLAITLAVLLFPTHTRIVITDWQVEEALPAVRPFISSGVFGTYVLIWRYAVLGLFWAVAALIAYRRWNSPFGLLVALMLFALPVNFNLAGYTESWLAFPRALRPVLRGASELNSAIGLFSFVAVFYLFPNGRAAPRWLGWAGLGLGLGVLGLGLLLVAGWGEDVLWSGVQGELVWVIFMVSFLLLLTLALGSQVYRYISVSPPEERRQTQLVLLALLAFVLSFFGQLFGLFFLEALFAQPVVSLLELHLQWLMLAALPLSLAVSMLSRGLWGASPLLNRALVYSALTIIVLSVYVIVVGGLGALFNTQNNPLLAVLATGLVAVMFQPLRQRLQRAVNRLMYGDRDDPAAAINRLGQRLESALAPEAVLPTLTETVAQALRLPYAAIALRQDDTFTLAAAYTANGHHAAQAGDAFPFIYQGEVIGQLIVAPRAPGERLEPADRRLLEQMARQASPAVHAVRLAADLQRSRERLVTAREEERRRLRRDLHDGVGSTLAALHLQAGGLRAMLVEPPSPPNPLAALDDLRAQIRAAVGEVRRVVYDLRPPALDELGLAGAIRARAAQMEQVGPGGPERPLPVTVDAPEHLPPLPAAVEVAAYRIAQEALTNVARHAQASQCRLRLWLGDGGLGLEIEDDGVGLPAARPAGVGLRSMQERAEELGGAFRLLPRAGGGTLVSVWLPLPGYTRADG